MTARDVKPTDIYTLGSNTHLYRHFFDEASGEYIITTIRPMTAQVETSPYDPGFVEGIFEDEFTGIICSTSIPDEELIPYLKTHHPEIFI